MRLDLSLDHSEFRGALNFSLFRDSVLALLSGLGNTLRDESASLRSCACWTNRGKQRVIEDCLAPGVIAVDGVPNMLMLWATPSPSSPRC